MDSRSSYSRLGHSSHIHWLISTFLGFFLFGGGSFMTTYGKGTPYDLKVLGSFGYIIMAILMWGFHMLDLNLRYREFPKLFPGSILSKDLKLTPGFSFGVLGGVCLFFGQFSLLLAWYLDPAGISITFLMLAGISPMTSVLAFIIYREKLTALQLIGMVISISGIIYLGVDKIDGNKVSYVLGIASLALFSLKNLCGRATQQSGLDAFTSGMITALGEILPGILLSVLLLIYQRFDLFLEIDTDFYICFFGFIFVAFGNYYINQAVMTGKIGVVITVINSNGILFVVLDYLCNGNFPDLHKFLACVVIILGVFVLILGDSLFDLIKYKEKVIENDVSSNIG